ncbi:HPr(Ser) kinase/phosphatase [Dolosicoccus paucivorans]|uniref:HPr kinase/phosphorylase n=1 Tax=Dolosicoccus paucivorans TaxID=84521 RepID=A0A1G8MRM4_9LACT|nr:HPr(Ser) kinase/phosphatase [Dolosicoccus paucivorans]PMB84167.1 HPr kinase/phosphorylase [Dolosicoccus paucivorans]PMC58417.1 HPr kinase/phosphorylase [Dolosicoccus paucivorans]SDI70516.1 Hpr(Ser) kinase/phosphatase [Dolosicoccus paucivorans]
MEPYVTVEEIVSMLDVDIAYGLDFKDREIDTSEISRPGIVLREDIRQYPKDRIQVLGYTEMSYIDLQTSEERLDIFRRICRRSTPAVVVSRGIEVPKELIQAAKEKEVPVLTARSRTTRVVANLTNFLESRLAERLSKHGVFIEIYGVGIMLVGGSGVGKSETALELIHRGHRLIADDRVDLYQIDELTLIGEAPDILRNLLEIRGLGIIDIQTLYGVASVRKTKRLELIVELVKDDGKTQYDRLGSAQETEQIFEVQVPKIRIPVKTGRNLAIIIEAAAANFRASAMGYDATKEFTQRLEKLIERNSQGEVE